MSDKLKGKSIIIADDEEFVRSHIARRLTSQGLTVWEAGTGDEVLEQAKNKPDLILMDVKMPGKGGIETTTLLKEDEETKDIPIILLSARAQQDDIDQGFASGADSYMTKPVTFKMISEKIEEYL